MLSTEELESVSIQLRNIENRKKLDYIIIDEILNTIKHGSTEYQFQCYKVLANYVADVVENADRIAPFIDELVFNESTFNDKNMLNVQLVLVSNILVTSSKSVKKLNKLFSKLSSIVKHEDIEGYEDPIIDILEELSDVSENNSFLLVVPVKDFEILHSKIKGYVNENSEATGDSIILKLSGRLQATTDSTDEYFKLLLSNLSSIIDDQVILNFSYTFQQPNWNTYYDTLAALLGANTVKLNKHSATLMLLLSNSMVSEDINAKVCELIPDNFVNSYFETLYSTFTISKPWEFQSIVLLKKLPVQKINLTTKSIKNYIEQLKIICNDATLQVRSDVVILQFQLLSKLFETSLLNNNCTNINLLLDYLKGVENTSHELLRQTIFKGYLHYLVLVEVQQLNDANTEELLRTVFQKINIENKVDTKFLASLSKALGVYAYKYKNTSWFQKVLAECEDVIDSMSDVEDIDQKDPNMQIFLNNIKYTKSI